MTLLRPCALLVVFLLSACAPPECSTGSYLEGGNVVTCFGTRTLTLPASEEARSLFSERLRPLGVDPDALPATYYFLPRDAATGPNARALFKPRRGAMGRELLVELNEAFVDAADDGALVLALIHEYGHLAQYQRGEPAGDELQQRLCAGASDSACEAAVLAHLQRIERDADAFLVERIGRWPIGLSPGFDPWALVDLINSTEAGPSYPPNPERIAPIAAALEARGLTRATATRARTLLDRLPALAAPAAEALRRQGGVPR